MGRSVWLFVILQLVCVFSACEKSVEVSYDSIGTSFCATEDTMYFKPDSAATLMFFDKSSGICAPLCGKPECAHTGADCNGSYGSEKGLAIYDGKVYRYSDYNKEIISSDLDGTNKRTVRSTDMPLMNDTVDNASLSNIGVVFHRDIFYFSAGVGKISQGKVEQSVAVLAYPLFSNKEGNLAYSSDKYLEASVMPYDAYLYICAYNDTTHELEIVRYDPIIDAGEILYSGNKHFDSMKFIAASDGLIFADSAADNPGVYRFSFADNTFERMYSFNYDTETPYYLYGFAGNNIIGGYPLGKEFKLCIKDLDGKTVMEKSVAIEGIRDGDLAFPMPAGSDEKYLYLHTKVWSNDYPFEGVVAVSLNGKRDISVCNNADLLK